jgi:SAM-dependent methyltransferase
MPMNYFHRKICSSEKWAQGVAQILPRRLDGFDLGDRMLEIGPGYGATTRVLASLTGQVTALEVDEASAALLRKEFDGGNVEIVHGDGADMPFEDNTFDSVVCFTMLHHVPSSALQDKLFAEAYRVLRPGGVLRGADSLPSLRFRILHIGDIMTTVDPATLPDRLATAGFGKVDVTHTPKQKVEFAGFKQG